VFHLSEKFVERLISCRKNKGVTQKEVAQAIKISERGYQRYEGGHHVPTLGITTALADYFGVSIDYLTGLTDDPHTRVFAAKLDFSPTSSKIGVATICKLPSGQEITLTEEQLHRMRKIEANLQEALAFADECRAPVEDIFPQFWNRRSGEPERR
jgi:transcriptional regulator with XRE-family HTH domain